MNKNKNKKPINSNCNEEMCIQGQLPSNLERKAELKLIKEKKHVNPHKIFIGLRKPNKKKY